MDQNGVSAHVDAIDARHGRQRRLVGAGQGRPDGPAGSQALDLLPSENVTQVIALALTLCSFAGGLFIPLSQFSPDLQTFAKFTPLYRLSQLVHYPLAGGTLQWGWILNLAVWFAIFVTGAAWSLGRDTARV